MAMRQAIVLGLVAAGAPPPVAAQLSIGVRIGVIAASNLVRDSIVQPVTLRQNVAATIGVAVDGPLDRKTRLGLTASVTRSDLVDRGDDRTITTLTTWTPGLTVTRTVGLGLAFRGAAALVIYRPDSRDGTPFQDDRPIRPAVGLGVTWTRPVGAVADLSADLSYDVHSFSTIALRTIGFSGEQVVHRLSIGIGVTRKYGRRA